MQLKIQRSQRAGLTQVIIFCLDIRAEYTAEEHANIQKYRLGSQAIYNSRAATKHLDRASAQLEAAGQKGNSAGQVWGGLIKGLASTALAKMQLNVTIASLGKGHHIECKDLEELLEAEDELRSASKNLTRYLEVANTFNGSEIVVEYANGEEKVHIAEHMPPLLEGPRPENPKRSSEPDTAIQAGPPRWSGEGDDPFDVGVQLRTLWSNPLFRQATYAVAGILVLILLAHSCSP